MQIEIISDSSDFTKNLARSFSKILRPGDIILFTGELGGGKTTFISGIAEGFGLTENLSSPSFTLLNEYRIAGQKKLIHADLYRLENIDEVSGIGLEDYIYNKKSIICIEWGNRAEDLVKKEFLEVNLSYLMDEDNGDTKRKIIFRSTGRHWDLRLAKFKKMLKKTGAGKEK